MKAWPRLAAGMLVAISVASCGGQDQAGPQSLEGMPPSGTVQLSAVQAAYIGSGTAGQGTLFFEGRSYPFSVDGLGVGGIGASTIEAEGEVYNLRNTRDFAGPFAQARYGFALGDMSGGDLWLENTNHVVMHLHAKRTGLMLSLGGDALVVTFK